MWLLKIDSAHSNQVTKSHSEATAFPQITYEACQFKIRKLKWQIITLDQSCHRLLWLDVNVKCGAQAEEALLLDIIHITLPPSL